MIHEITRANCSLSVTASSSLFTSVLIKFAPAYMRACARMCVYVCACVAACVCGESVCVCACVCVCENAYVCP